MPVITRLLSAVMILLGVVMVTVALANGGGPLAFGVLIGVLFICAGVGRIWMEHKR